ncbi:aldose 1-epimerase [Varunaivibrio sulfuroxidans]|uniref:Aldose 1-epimerase n=1 Tax=Varunaivibrio sulfuroxidans TaxID=1773489 RepID=A0A4R3J8S9_9PROT|nr:aldose 1-epimerase [Varunaivibrio sulfuroxidans]TCS60940.1 aldose 1-epimerase [Varunaivibrio sulfuroxidans]WES31652.1 aldose 1-epimerase [Varunaivibrio sulfuroxidans]
MASLLTLHAGNLTAILAPSLGGALAAFREETPSGLVDWLRPAPPDCADVLKSACYPLVPFSNRIANGRFSWRGRAVSLPANFPPEPHAIHGLAWQRPWRVVECTPARAVLALRHDAEPWPWPFTVRQTVALSPQALRITLSLENRAAEAMPGGLGLHPFFPRNDHTRLRADVRAMQTSGPGRMPPTLDRAHPTIAALGASDGVPEGLDNAFQDWRGSLTVHQDDIGRALSMGATSLLRHLVIYTPKNAPFFCAEPVSHLTGAFAADADTALAAGLVEIAPGETLEATVAFTPTPASS